MLSDSDSEMTATEAAVLCGVGFLTGIVNTLAGAGSLITVPLLVLVGLPGMVANGTNRIGIFLQNTVAAWRFWAEGVSGLATALPVLAPVIIGSVIGAAAISQLADQTFEWLFGIVMVLLLLPLLFRPPANPERIERPWPAWISFPVFFAIGLFGGAFQAGVGIFLILALSYAGHDLVRANSIKVVINAVLTATVIPVFALQGHIAWLPGLTLGLGFAAGGVVGVRLAVSRGERLIRPVLAAAVLGLAGRMVGLY